MAGHSHGHGDDHGSNKGVALLIAVLALFLALAETGAKSAQTNALAQNIEAANLWAFFQARSIRQTTAGAAAELATLEMVGLEAGERRAAIERQIAAWRARIQGWESEPATGEGRRELAARAQRAQEVRDRSMSAYHMFEFGSAAFQVAIVLASASIVTAVPLLAIMGGVLGVIGFGLSMLGFFAPTLIHF